MKLLNVLGPALATLTVVQASNMSLTDALQLLQGLPPCSLNCLVQSGPLGGCQVTNIDCLCKSAAVTRATADCLLDNCIMKESVALARVEATVCDLPHDSKYPTALGAAIMTGSVCFAMVALRLVARHFSGNKLWLDDLFQVLGAIVMIPLLATAILASSHGIGKHIYDIDFQGSYTDVFKYYYLVEVIYHVHSTLIKLCMLFLYIRIFPDQLTKRMVYVGITFLVISQMVVTLLTIFQCRPVRAIYDFDLKDTQKQCLSLANVATAGTAFNIAAELMILLIPVPVVRSLQMSKERKIGIFILFSLGAIVIGIAAVRAPKLTSLDDRRDIPWTLAPPFIWSCAELTASNIVITIPAISQFLHSGYIKCKAWKEKTGRTVVGTRVLAPFHRRTHKTLPHRQKMMDSIDSTGHITLIRAGEPVKYSNEKSRNTASTISTLDSKTFRGSQASHEYEHSLSTGGTMSSNTLHQGSQAHGSDDGDKV